MRATSRTTLSLGDLVEVPIGIANATADKDVKLDTAIVATGRKRQQVYIDPEGWRELHVTDEETGEVEVVRVPRILSDEDCSKGVFVGDTFYPIPAEEIEDAREAVRLSAVEVLEFIDFRRVPTDRLTGSYWVQPDPGFAKPQGVLMAAMRKTHRAAVVKFNLRDRQRLGVLRVRKTADGDAFLLNGVCYADHWREPDDVVLAAAHVEVDERAVTAAVSIIESMSGDGTSLDEARDDLIPAMERLIERAVNGELLPAPDTEEQPAEATAEAAAQPEHARA